MIRYQLVCQCRHQFDSWFRSSADFDNQKRQDLLNCPHCGSQNVEKALMAPNIANTGKRHKGADGSFEKVAGHLSLSEKQSEFLKDVKKLRDQVTQNADYVGEKFSEEARKIHYGESEKRGIFGSARPDQIGELVDEGIAVLPLPALPEEKN